MRKSVPKNVDAGNKTVAEQLGLGPEVRELKLGQSFTNSKSASFHTLRYDFKPASVDMTKVATLAVGENHEVTVTVPHMDGAATPQTVFKGSHQPYKKECVLIFDRNTGEVTLEKLTHNVQLKKTRSEPKHNRQVPFPACPADFKPSASKQSSKSSSSNQRKTSAHQKSHSGTRAQQMASSLSKVIPRHSPLHASPSYPQKKSPQMPVAASLSVTDTESVVKTSAASPSDTERTISYLQDQQSSNVNLSESSSGSSSSSSSSESSSESSSDSSSVGSDVESHQKPAKSSPSFYANNGTSNGRESPIEKLLTEDLQLSESGSDD